MKLNRWNYEKQEYDPYEVPDDWKCKTFSMDMEELVNCPRCGMAITYGSGYTSQEIHTYHGMGYAVCGDCYREESNRRMKYEDSRR